MPIRFLRRRDVRELTGKPDSTIYLHVRQGLFPPPVRLGGNTSGWALHEVEAVNRALLAGSSEDDIKVLVRRLIEQRQAPARVVA